MKKDTVPPVAFLGYIEPEDGGAAYKAKITAYAPADPSTVPGVEPPVEPGPPNIPAFPIWGPPGFKPGGGFPDKPGYPTIPGGGDNINVPSFPIWGPPGSRPGSGFPNKPGYPTVPDVPIIDPPPIIPQPPDPNAPKPSHPINLPPPGEPPAGTGWALVYVLGVGWIWVLLPMSAGARK